MHVRHAAVAFTNDVPREQFRQRDTPSCADALGVAASSRYRPVGHAWQREMLVPCEYVADGQTLHFFAGSSRYRPDVHGVQLDTVMWSARSFALAARVRPAGHSVQFAPGASSLSWYLPAEQT